MPRRRIGLLVENREGGAIPPHQWGAVPREGVQRSSAMWHGDATWLAVAEVLAEPRGQRGLGFCQGRRDGRRRLPAFPDEPTLIQRTNERATPAHPTDFQPACPS